jgi:hypothetical protein
MDSMKDKKATESAVIEQQIKDYLKQGGRIKKIPPGESAEINTGKLHLRKESKRNKSPLLDKLWKDKY